jgi:hypothetical protein
VAVSAFSRHLEDDVHLYLVFVDTAGRTVDRGSRSFLGDRWRSSRLADYIRSAGENRHLVYSLVVAAEEGSLGRIDHGRSHCSHYGRRSTGHPVGLHRIRSLHIRHVAAEGARSPEREVDRSCHFVVEGGSQRCIIAPEPAGADRSRADGEGGIGELDYRPCCQSNGRQGRA